MQRTPSNPLIDATVTASHLPDTAYVRQKENIRHDFTEDELVTLKEQFFQLSKKLAARLELGKSLKLVAEGSEFPVESLEDLLEDIRHAEFGSLDVKTLKARHAATLAKINTGHEPVEHVLYGLDYQDLNVMAFYDEDGLYVYDRPLLAEERQTKIKTITTKAS